MHCAKLGDPRQDPAGAAQLQIRAPDLGPTALYRNAAFDDFRIAKSPFPRLAKSAVSRPGAVTRKISKSAEAVIVGKSARH